MSRVANKPIVIDDKVKVTIHDGVVNVEGPKGKLAQVILQSAQVDVKGQEIIVKRPNDEINSRQSQGTMYRLIANMVTGVSKGFERNLRIEGVGFRAEVKGKTLSLLLGYSHPVILDIPEGVQVKVGKPTEVALEGISKDAVGRFAAEIRSAYEPEPYKGKGVRYVDEIVRRKAGKAVAK